jgi:hypothetical protein
MKGTKMAEEVTVMMPLALTPEMIRAVRDHKTTKTDDQDESNRRIGWLLSAWDVLIEHRIPLANFNVEICGPSALVDDKGNFVGQVICSAQGDLTKVSEQKYEIKLNPLGSVPIAVNNPGIGKS